MAGKILIALQYWGGDREPAGKLLRFLADLEPKHSDLADILFVNRFDCLADTDAATYASKKFNIFSYRSRRRGTGWPAGCNDLFFSTMEWVQSMTEAKKVPQYKAVFTCEADGCPLWTDWVARLSNAWDRAQSKQKVYLAGPYIPPPNEHINGNTLISCDQKFLTWLVKGVGGAPSNVGWDYILFPVFKKWGVANLPEMVSLYHTVGYTKEVFDGLRAKNVVWVHGAKDDTLMNLSRTANFPVDGE